jgi:hypothetical protein
MCAGRPNKSSMMSARLLGVATTSAVPSELAAFDEFARELRHDLLIRG